MEGDSQPDQLLNPEKKDPEIPFFKLELSPAIDVSTEDAISLINCFKGYNHLADLYNSGTTDQELTAIMPSTAATLLNEVFPKPAEDGQIEEPPVLLKEIPIVDISKGGRVRSIPVDDETQLKILLIQARNFTHDVSNIPNAILAVEDMNNFFKTHGLETEEAFRQPLDVRERLKTTLLHAQESLGNEILFKEVSADALGATFGAFMSTILSPESLDVVISPDLDKEMMELPIYWLSIAAADLAQNIKRKEDREGKKIRTLVIIEKDKKTGMLHIKVEDDGSPYPQEFVDEGFIRGKGENVGGKHIAMSAHSETAQKLGGKVLAINEYDKEVDTYFPQTHILLPYKSKPKPL